MRITKSRAGHYTVSIYADATRGARRLHSSPLHPSIVSARRHGRDVMETLERERAEGTGLFSAMARDA